LKEKYCLEEVGIDGRIMDLKKIVAVDLALIHLAQEMKKCHKLVKTLKFQGS
jgi:hypothetical protein